MLCWTGQGSSALSWSGLLFGVLGCHKHGSPVLMGLSSSELVNTRWQHIGLWLLNLWGQCSGCCSAVVSGVVGSKDKFLLMEMWYICGALLRGVGIFNSCSHSHNLHLLVQVLFQRCHLMWSQSNQIVFLLAGFVGVVLSYCRRKLCIFTP